MLKMRSQISRAVLSVSCCDKKLWLTFGKIIIFYYINISSMNCYRKGNNRNTQERHCVNDRGCYVKMKYKFND